MSEIKELLEILALSLAIISELEYISRRIYKIIKKLTKNPPE